MKIRFCFWMLTILGSFLSGLDFTLLGGILVLSSFINEFFPELSVNRNIHHFGTFCQYSNIKLVAISFIPCGLGWVFGFLALRMQLRCGPRTLMIISSMLVFLGGGISIFLIDFASFLMGRILIGIGMAVLRQVVPIYVTEVPPKGMWDDLDIAYEFGSKAGNIWGSFFIFIPILHGQNLEWRLPAFPLMFIAVSVGLASLLVPESPRYHIIRGNPNDIARRTLARILDPQDVELEYQRLEQAIQQQVNPFREIFKKINTPFLRIKFISIAFQSFLGSTTLFSFLPGFLVGVGLGTKSSFFSSLIIGLTSMIGMGFSVLLIRKWRFGRWMVLLTACLFMIFAQICVGVFIMLEVKPSHHLEHGIGAVTILFICLFVFNSSMLPGRLGWLASNYPAMTQMPGTFLSRNTSTTIDFLLSQIYILAMCYMHGWIFIIFALVSIAMLCFISYYIPETTGLRIDQMMGVWRQHRYWRKFVPPLDDVELLDMNEGHLKFIYACQPGSFGLFWL